MRVVLDSGVVISALLVPDGSVAWLRGLWVTGSITPLVSQATVGELIRVLAYPKFKLTSDEIQTVLAEYLPYCETVSVAGGASEGLPECRDPADQEFLELAATGRAEALVTGDRDLLALEAELPFAIVAPADLKRRLGP